MEKTAIARAAVVLSSAAAMAQQVSIDGMLAC